MFESLSQMLATNQFMSGGVVIVVLGAALTALRKVPENLYAWIMRKITLRIDIQQTDEAFQWVQMWLAKKGGVMRDVSVYTKHSEDEITDFTKPIDNRPKVYFTPAPGQHMFWFHRRPMLVSRTRPNEGGLTKSIFQKMGGDGVSDETLTIRIFSRDIKLYERLLNEARDVALPQDGKIDIRISNAKWGGYWLLADRIRPRPIESVILPNNRHHDILNDIKQFLAAFPWYASLGIPYRRGYLLYGPPGNGKTSLVVALASALKMNVYVLNLSGTNMTDSKLSELLTSVSENSIVLMEDIDCAFVKREKKKDEEHLTFSGLLNALDGVSGKDGRIIFMTTNHIERLDPALIRPGRIDIRCEIANATQEQIGIMFKRFYPESDDALANKFASKLKSDQVSMAAIQGHLMNYKGQPFAAINHFNEIMEEIVKNQEYLKRVAEEEAAAALEATVVAAPAATGEVPCVS